MNVANLANRANDFTELVDDLAAHWTDSALEILRTSGITGSSVSLELETWHTLREVLQSALRRQQEVPVSLPVLREQSLLRATLRVARKLEPESDAFALEELIHPWIVRQKLRKSERRPFTQSPRRRVATGASQPSSLSGYYFQRMSAAGGYSRRVS